MAGNRTVKRLYRVQHHLLLLPSQQQVADLFRFEGMRWQGQFVQQEFGKQDVDAQVVTLGLNAGRRVEHVAGVRNVPLDDANFAGHDVAIVHARLKFGQDAVGFLIVFGFAAKGELNIEEATQAVGS